VSVTPAIDRDHGGKRLQCRTEPMDELDVFWRLGLALSIGLLLGLERGWHERAAAEGGRIAGIRTFALTGLLGGVSAWLAGFSTPLVLAIGFLAMTALLTAGYLVRLRTSGDLGLTTEVALLLTFALGAASVQGDAEPAAAVAVVAAFLLSIKARLHGWVGRMKAIELDSLLKLALISIVMLPLLPNEGYGPGATLNPYEIWWAVVIVAGLSFVGYLAIRLGGTDLGVLLTGLFGGLASSTSTSLALARLLKDRPEAAPIGAAGIVIAGSVSFFRVLLLVVIFQPALVPLLLLPMMAMGGLGLACALLIRLFAASATSAGGEAAEIANPLDLKTALTFGAVLAVVSLGVFYLERWIGTGGLYAGAALAGLTDVDALTISVSKLVGENFAAAIAANAIFIAVAVNTTVKAGISLAVGNRRLGLIVLPVNAAIIAAGAVALWLTG
jgi:uncharacterized membrane protein (DUF4010 family)